MGALFLAVFRGLGRRVSLTLIMFAGMMAAGAIGYLIALTFGLSREATMWVMFASYFVPLMALAWWLGLRNSN